MSFQQSKSLTPENIETALLISGCEYKKENLTKELISILDIIPDFKLEEIFCLLGIDWQDTILDSQTLNRAKQSLIEVLK